MNIAKTRGQREKRYVPFSAFDDSEEAEPSVDPARFYPSDSPRTPNHWSHPTEGWGEDAEARLLSREARALIERTIETLPANQKMVIRLRDLEV